MQHNIDCVIISNSDDFRFLLPNLEQIHKIFNKIVIALGNQLWNGESEDKDKLDKFKSLVSKKCSNVDIVEYNVPKDAILSIKDRVASEMYWEGHARYIAYNSLASHDYVMFLDSDEVIHGALFKQWLDTNEYKKYDVMKLKNYWYWREPVYRAMNYYEDSVILIKNKTFDPLDIFDNRGRHGLYENCKGSNKIRNAGGNKIFIHHYSWVRSQKDMETKVRSWGHRNDRKDWLDLVKEEFSRPFNGTDFVKGLKYDTIDNIFGILGSQ